MTKYFSFILFVTFIVLQSADQQPIEIIQAKPKIHSLKSFACKAIVLQMKQFLDSNNPDNARRKTVQKYIDTIPTLPIELHNSLKKNLAAHMMDRLTTIHTAKPLYPPTSNWCLSKDGTLLLHQDQSNLNQFVLKNLNTQEEKRIEHEEFSRQTPDGQIIIRPFITEKNSILFYTRNQGAINSCIFKYVPETKTIEKSMLSIPIYHLLRVSTDMNRLFFFKTMAVDDYVLYDIQKSVESRIQGNVSHIDDDYITTKHNDRFHCYTTQKGNLYMQGGTGTGISTINFPYLICTKIVKPGSYWPKSLEIWDIPRKQPIKKIILPCKINDFLQSNRNNIEITSTNCSFYSINLGAGNYKKRKTYSERKEGEYLTCAENSLLMRIFDKKFPSRYYVVNLLTRKLSIPLVELNGIDVTGCHYANKDMTRIGGLLEGHVPFVYTTPLHILYKTPLPELLSMLFKHGNKTDTQHS